jgi:hypothetical protein
MSPEATQRRAERRKATSPYYAAQRMEALRRALAPDGRCALCGMKPRKIALQIDHVDGRDWTPRQHNAWIRAARYWREFEAGVRLRALCRKCNGKYRPPGFVLGVKKEHWPVVEQVESDHVPF